MKRDAVRVDTSRPMTDSGAPANPQPGAAIRHAAGTADVALARGLFEEYAAWLDEDLCFQGFAEELAALPGKYAPPWGRLLLAGAPGDAFGCVALRPLDDGPHGPVGEVKRLYVQPRARGRGWGARLARAVIAEARVAGYAELKLDTLERMADARRLYASLGFVPCAPYYHNPLGAPVYMALDLLARGDAR
jgi:GNAT superfamily N-acetyltransferase